MRLKKIYLSKRRITIQNIEIGKQYLINTHDWFFAPDGVSYKAVFGTVNAVLDDSQTLGIKTNRGSTNWYVSIGCMLVAGCQIHYAFRVEEENVNLENSKTEVEHEGALSLNEIMSRIYNADKLVKITP